MSEDRPAAGSVTPPSDGSAPASLSALPAGVTPILAPVIYASSLQLMRAGSDTTLIVSQPRPVTVQAETGVTLAAMAEAVAIIHMSAATMKDLYIVLGEGVKDYEKQYGEIKTSFTLSRVEQ